MLRDIELRLERLAYYFFRIPCAKHVSEGIEPLPELDFTAETIEEDVKTRLKQFEAAKNYVFSLVLAQAEAQMLINLKELTEEIETSADLARLTSSYDKLRTSIIMMIKDKELEGIPLVMYTDLSGEANKQ